MPPNNVARNNAAIAEIFRNPPIAVCVGGEGEGSTSPTDKPVSADRHAMRETKAIYFVNC